jgi:oxygen-independent coproporphyrinogen-3 oxidase
VILSGVGRRGSRRSNLEALERIHKLWKGRLSLDLIAGLPGQTRDVLIKDIEEILSFKPDHISLYALTIEDGTPLAKKMASPEPPAVPAEEVSDELWISGRDFLESRGYRQYEVSNFALPGFESEHNRTYWTMNSWIGIGPSASGTVFMGDIAIRKTNTTDIRKWLSDPANSFDLEILSRQDCIKEFLMMGMRLAEGIDRKSFKDRFGTDILELTGDTVRAWQKRKLLVAGNDRIALNRKGLLLLNRFLDDCLEEMC